MREASNHIVVDNILKHRNSIKRWLLDRFSVIQQYEHKSVLTIFIIA